MTAWRVWGFDRGDRASGGSVRPTVDGPLAVEHPSASPASPSPHRRGCRRPGRSTRRSPGSRRSAATRRATTTARARCRRHPVIRWRYPTTGALCSTLHRPCRHARLVRHRLDRPAQRDPARRRLDRGPRGRLRRALPLPERPHRRPIRPDLVTGDLAKGSATCDPDGYPLYYAGSRDNLFRIVAMDRPTPDRAVVDRTRTPPCRDPLWNNDWDGGAAGASATTCWRAARTAGSTS